MAKRLKTIVKQFEKLREECNALVKQVIGDWCKENNAVFSYGMGVEYRVVVEKDEIVEGCCLIDNPDIDCHYESVYDYWYYDAEPSLEVTAILDAYEDMFGCWYQSDCNRGVWRGV